MAEEIKDQPKSSSEECGDASGENAAKKRKLSPEPSPNQQQKPRRRTICDRCHRPVPQTCLCEALPSRPIALGRTEIVVLQHPLELKNHKAASHRSLPLLELCLEPSSLRVCTGRRFGNESLGNDLLVKIRNQDNYIPILVFPKIKVTGMDQNTNSDEGENSEAYKEDDATVWSLNKLLKEVTEDENNKTDPRKIMLLVLDATWKHAREMHLANLKTGQYPKHMLRLSLEKEDLKGFRPGRFELRGKASKKGYQKSKKNRDDELLSIGETWMSTAECIAWIVSRIESSSSETKMNDTDENDDSCMSLYEILMKPLDAMVHKWKSFVTKGRGGKRC